MIEVEVVPANEWKEMTEDAHFDVFGESLPKDQERISFALIALREKLPLGFVTCLEFDKETLYWKFGGTVPGTQETSLSWLVYQTGLEWCKAKYKRITTYIENDNVVMLKFALKAGFKIIGVRIYNNRIFVEHLLES